MQLRTSRLSRLSVAALGLASTLLGSIGAIAHSSSSFDSLSAGAVVEEARVVAATNQQLAESPRPGSAPKECSVSYARRKQQGAGDCLTLKTSCGEKVVVAALHHSEKGDSIQDTSFKEHGEFCPVYFQTYVPLGWCLESELGKGTCRLPNSPKEAKAGVKGRTLVPAELNRR